LLVFVVVYDHLGEDDLGDDGQLHGFAGQAFDYRIAVRGLVQEERGAQNPSARLVESGGIWFRKHNSL
jgi:hypothetical protein